jgi:hypothetical protein
VADIPHAVLSEELTKRMQNRRVVSAVFLTFTLEPDFFEQEVVPTLLDLPLQQAAALRLLQLEDELKSAADHIAVYYDRAGLVAGTQSAKLDIRRIPVTYSTGCFHPKNALVLTEATQPDDDGHRRRSLIVVTLSANLTRAGWWENVESCHIEETTEGELCSFRDDLLACIKRVKAAAHVEEDHSALEAIRAFVLKLNQRQRRTTDGVLWPRLYTSEQSLPDFLDEACRENLQGLCLEIISPYFDESEARPLEELLNRLHPREVRVFLPRSDDGSALCSDSCYNAVRSLASWGHLPLDRVRAAKNEQVKRRRVHAKVYRFFHPHRRYEALLVGSVNLTSAAHSKGGNFETAFLIETSPKQTPDWWLTTDSRKPSVFLGAEPEEITTATTHLSIRFDWSNDSAAAFWDASTASGHLKVSAQGAPLFSIESLPARTWRTLPYTDALVLKGILPSTSFLAVSADDGPTATILVQEEGMLDKPSLLFHLTSAEILRYWSLLTPEQRAAFLAERVGAIPEALIQLGQTSQPLPSAGNSIFDSFAGIYHAFQALETFVLEALEAGRFKEAEYRLLGKKYDSLYNLLDRVLQETEGDLVGRYTIVLSAKQLLREVERAYPEFRKAHWERFKTLKRRIIEAERIRQSFSFGDRTEREAFLTWFDDWFLARQFKEAAAT